MQDHCRIRKPSAPEIKTYSSMVPYTITEPVFTVVIGASRLLVDFAGGLKIGFMEELGHDEAPGQ